MKRKLAELLAEAKAALSAPDVEKAMATTLLEDIAHFKADLARRDVGRDEIALRAIELGMALGAPIAERYFTRHDKEAKRGRDLAAERREKKKELRAAIVKLLLKQPGATDVDLAGQLMPDFGTTAEDKKADDYGLLRERTIRAEVAAQRRLLRK
jgi:hypothetical protein